MKTIDQADFKEALRVLLEETFESAPSEIGSVYLDDGVGIFVTLDSIEADFASKTINETSIAAHTEHARFYLEVLNKYMLNTAEFVNWKSSWRIKTVDESEWKTLRKSLWSEYKKVGETFAVNEKWDVNIMTVALAIIAHSAYHLGAIRQLIKEKLNGK